jgi:hypothetical protein
MLSEVPFVERRCGIDRRAFSHGPDRRRVGRPPKPDDEKLKPFSTSLSDEDFERLQRLAAEQGLSPAEYARDILVARLRISIFQK